jgi:hypothetical protein
MTFWRAFLKVELTPIFLLFSFSAIGVHSAMRQAQQTPVPARPGFQIRWPRAELHVAGGQYGQRPDATGSNETRTAHHHSSHQEATAETAAAKATAAKTEAGLWAAVGAQLFANQQLLAAHPRQ